MAAYLGSAVLQKKVRVMSEQYRSFRQPMSMTMQSPGLQAGLVRLMMGVGGVGAEGDNGLEAPQRRSPPPRTG